MSEAILFQTTSALRTALRLEIITLVWMVIEAAVAVAAASLHGVCCWLRSESTARLS
jgi:Na+/H+ antiporter NhaB